MTTKIEWAEETWNPITGCTRISPGCDRCYIERTPPFRMAGHRFDKPGIGGTTGVQLHPDRLDQPLRWRKPRRAFVNSLSDLFHADVPDDYIAQAFAVMSLAQQHTFQVLTKRPARARALLSSGAFIREQGRHWITHSRRPFGTPDPGWPLPNVWLGVTAEDQHWADLRIPILLDTPAAVRWVSYEPAIGPLSLHRYLPTAPGGSGSYPTRHITQRYPAEFAQWKRDIGIDWVVCGGETGPGSRPMHPQWARDVRDQCAAVGVPFFFKQWGDWAPVLPDVWENRRETDHDVRVDGYHWPLSQPHGVDDGSEVVMRRIGKKAAGRQLDGRTWDEYPQAVTA